MFAFHGLPGSRCQQHPDPSVARAAGLRVIHVDRPGFGRSDAQPGRALADWPEDVALLAAALGLRRFGVVGVSGGGPFALACMAALGDRITRAAVVSGVGPPGSMRDGRMTVPARLGFAAAPHAAWIVRAALRPFAHVARTAPARYPDRVARHLAPVDAAILARPEVRAMFSLDLAEAFRKGVDSMAHELALLARPWRLPLASIRAPVALWHGEADRMIPVSAARHLAAAVRGARATIVHDAGHFMAFDTWPEIVRWLAERG